MQKKYIVRLKVEERAHLEGILKKLKGGSEKVKQAQILLKANIKECAWTDKQIADAFGCRTRTIEQLRKRLVSEGFEAAVERKRRKTPPIPKKLDGEQEAKIIAMRLGKPPKGYANGSLRLLAEPVVVLKLSTRSVTKRYAKRLKKQDDPPQNPVLGHPAETGCGVRCDYGRRT